VQHFWKRWSAEYVKALLKFNKWHFPSRNLQVGDVVCVHEDGLVPTKWPLARITAVHPGDDGLVRVVTLKTHKGSYKRPAKKIALLLPHSHT
jgi:cell shape-determining protein MreC